MPVDHARVHERQRRWPARSAQGPYEIGTTSRKLSPQRGAMATTSGKLCRSSGSAQEGTSPQFIRGNYRRLRLFGGQYAELVALGIGQDHPAHVVALTDVDMPGTHVDQPLHLGLPVVRPEVDVQPVLPVLLLRHEVEQQLRVGVRGGTDDRLG